MTTTLNANRIDRQAKTAVCDIFIGSDYSSVKSPTGVTLVAMVGEDSDWSCLDIPTVRLLGKLRDTNSAEVTLSFDELKLFAGLARQFPDTGSTPATNGTTLVQPSAPIAPHATIPNGWASTETPAVPFGPDATVENIPVPAPSVPSAETSPVPTIVGCASNNGDIAPPIAPAVPAAPVASAEQDYWSQRRQDMTAAHRQRQMRQVTREGTDQDPIWEVKYYIPSAVSQPSDVSGRDAMFADLSKRMKRARLLQWDGSCYYGRERDVKPLDSQMKAEVQAWNERPEVKVTEFRRKGRRLMCQWEAEPVTAERMAKIRGSAFVKLLDLMTEVAEALQESLSNYAQTEADTLAQLDQEAAQGGEGPTHRKLWDARDRRIKGMASAVSRARTDLKVAQECIEVFGIGDEMEELTTDIERVISQAQIELDNMRRLHRAQSGK